MMSLDNLKLLDKREKVQIIKGNSHFHGEYTILDRFLLNWKFILSEETLIKFIEYNISTVL